MKKVEGFEGIYLRGKTYTYVLDLPPDPLTGKRNQKTKGGFETPEAADTARDELKLVIKKGNYKPDSKMTVEEYFGFWLEEFSRKKHRLTTYITNRDLVNKKIIPVLGKRKMVDVDADDIEDMLDAYLEKHSPAYVHGIFRVIRRAFRLAYYKWEIITVDIMPKVDAPVVKKKDRLTWTLEQCQTFLDAAAHSPYHEAYVIAINTGFRRGECIGFRETDLHPTEKYLEVTQSLTYHKEFGFIVQAPKTEKSERKMPIEDDYIYNVLQNKININEMNKKELGDEYQDQWGLLVCHKDGSPVRPSQLRYDYEKLIKETGLPYIRFHDLRHSFATNLWDMGYDIKDVQELLGHSTLAVTGDIYTHMRDSKRRTVMSGFSEAMRKAKSGG